MKTLYLMRHGETRFNQLHKIQGACDSPLTEKGRRQAQIARTYFVSQQIQFGAAYSSTQERASDTLEIVAPNRAYTRLKSLKEWDFGRFEAESEDLNPKAVPYGDFFAAFGGERQAQVEARMLSALTETLKQTDATTVLAVSHGGALACFTRATGNQMPTNLKNCCILKFSFDETQFVLEDVINHDFSMLEKE
ncbi:MAG: histidine phosphatase family protein [Streptococcaceae bacterium]|jgi:probable phosphoglycerate mutase|nr:histidine phosphatase family protein [Streptococcaceae bacterium]